MTLLDVLDKNLIKVPLLSTDRQGVISELVEVYQKVRGISNEDAENIKRAVIARELQASTAMENAIAIPHAKVAGIEHPIVIIGVSKLGVDFGEKEKSKVFFMVIAPENKPAEHIQLLSSIAKLCSSPVMARLLSGAKTKDEAYQLFID